MSIATFVLGKEKSMPLWAKFATALFGSVVLALISQLSVPTPFTPIPLSMQTLGVLVLAGTLGPELAAWSIMTYLAEASMGLPVLAGWKIVPAWWMLWQGGFLVGFVPAAWVTGKLLQLRREQHPLYTLFCCLSGLATVLACGTLYMAAFMGFKAAFVAGVMPFLVGETLKAFAAAATLTGAYRLVR